MPISARKKGQQSAVSCPLLPVATGSHRPEAVTECLQIQGRFTVILVKTALVWSRQTPVM